MYRLVFTLLVGSFTLLYAAQDSAKSECDKDFTMVDYIKFDGICIEITKSMADKISKIVDEHKDEAEILYETFKPNSKESDEKKEVKKELKEQRVKSEDKAEDKAQKKIESVAFNLEEAKKLYAKCIACHGVKAEKKALNKSEIAAAKDESELALMMKSYREGELNKNGLGGMMKAQMAGYSDEQIEILAHYISNIDNF